MRLIIAPACAVARVCHEAAPSHLLRLVSPDHADAPPDGPMASLTLPMHDITAPRPGLTAPSPQLVQALLAFSAGWNGARPLVAQCLAGVSRSTAAAFIIACQKRPEVSELQMALVLRRFAPQATPNPLIVAHADALLQRSGRMVAAVAAIGRGCEFTAAVCAELNIAASGGIPCPASDPAGPSQTLGITVEAVARGRDGHFLREEIESRVPIPTSSNFHSAP